ncbi:MAG: hypothetical protein HOJ34_00545 [Kordiimonadaceae bacterium]|nr:hypothetical protein [Kordiimonadaceae bacterium]
MNKAFEMENPNGINANNKTRIIIAVLVVFGLLSMAVAWRYANTEQAREKLNWQNRISAVLNGRADAVEKWLQGNKNAIDDLSENATLRLYLSSLSSDMGLVNAGEAALGEYILPLLNDRANQNGFSAIDSEQFEVNANTPRQKHAGLAITDTTGKILVATAGMPRVEVAVNTYIYESENRNIMMIGPYDGESGLPTI